MEKEIDMSEKKELHERAVRELYTGDDIDNILAEKTFSNSILYDFTTPENKMVPAGLIVSCGGEREDVLDIFKSDISERLSRDEDIRDMKMSRIVDKVDEIYYELSNRLKGVEYLLFIKNISLKEGYVDYSNRLSSLIGMFLREGSSKSSAVLYVTDRENDNIKFLKDSFDVELLEEIGDIKVWGIEV